MLISSLPLAVNSGAVFLGFLLVFTVVVAFGLYTRRGSGIEQRPGKNGPSTIKGDEGEGGTFGGPGTR